MNMTKKERALLFTCVLVLVVFFGGLLYILRQQVETKTTPSTNRRTFGALLPAPSPTVPALFSDNFSDNSQNWDVGNEAKYGSTINNGSLTMTESNHKPFREPLPSDVSYGDVAVSVSLTLLDGDQNDSVGLYFRANGSSGQGYYVDIYGDDTYDIAKITADAAQKIHATYLAEPQHSSALHPKGQKNSVMVIMKAAHIVLLINNSVVKSVQDSEFSNGKIMLFVENGNSSNSVVASFDAITVIPAPDRLPG